ncbi:restriction endonuclease subunit S [Microcystis sp. M113S1]|jgi:type I restriction enzyme S subunit|uniref:restriction endonuclease subunit S n=1 Tax=Microcystis sp. M113S1 TaxID=2771104 RepID=UPI00338E0473
MIMIYPSEITKKWPHRPLSEVVDFLDSKRKPITQKDRVPGPYPYYGANGQQDSVADYIFDEPLVLLAEDGGHFGDADKTIAYQVEGKCWVNNHAHVLRPKKDVDIRYICRHLERYDVTPFITGSTRGKLTKTAANNIPIALPPLEEQRRIAAILDKADGVRRKRKEAIRLTEELLKSTFLEMFGDPVTNPKGWEKIKLGNLCTIVRGGSPRPINDYLGGSIPWIKIGDATEGDDIYIYKTAEAIKPDGVKKSRYLEPGSLIFANCGVSLGFARILKIAGCIHDGWLAFSDLDKSINQIFLLKLLNSITEHFRAIAPDGTQPNLNTTIMKNFEIPVPPIDLQEKFAVVSHYLTDSIKKNSEMFEQSENLFNSLLQRAFRGEL